MSRIVFLSLAALLPLGFALGAAAGSDSTAGAYASSPTCDIRVERQGSSFVLEGLVFAPTPVSGSYEFEISQGGHAGDSDIRQGGDFEVAPGTDTSLGIVSLSHQGTYAATLTVRFDDGSPACTRQVGTEWRL